MRRKGKERDNFFGIQNDESDDDSNASDESEIEESDDDEFTAEGPPAKRRKRNPRKKSAKKDASKTKIKTIYRHSDGAKKPKTLPWNKAVKGEFLVLTCVWTQGLFS